MDDCEIRKPPVFSDQGSVWFDRPEWDARNSHFASDIRPSLGEGCQWDFTVHHPSKDPGSLVINGSESLPPDYATLLLDKTVGSITILKPNTPVSFLSGGGDKVFTLVVGKHEYLQSLTKQYIPMRYEVRQNFPNPFNPSTTISYGLPERSIVRLVIYNALGQVVKELVNAEVPAGNQSVVWNAVGVSSGLYYYTIEAASIEVPGKRFVDTKKMLLIK